MDRFFTLAKLEAGDMELERSRVDVGEVCRETVLDFYQILTRQGDPRGSRDPGGSGWGCCDREALRRILNNLISNAVRYGGDGGYLGVSLREGEDALFLEVADRGKGVAPGAGEQVFQRLVTLEDSRSSGEGADWGCPSPESWPGEWEETLTWRVSPDSALSLRSDCPNGKTKEIRKNCANFLKSPGTTMGR